MPPSPPPPGRRRRSRREASEASEADARVASPSASPSRAPRKAPRKSLETSALYLKRNTEGIDLRVSYSFFDKRPSAKQATEMARQLLVEALGALEAGDVADVGFREEAKNYLGIRHLQLDTEEGGERVEEL
jgi:hypothetical protein